MVQMRDFHRYRVLQPEATLEFYSSNLSKDMKPYPTQYFCESRHPSFSTISKALIGPNNIKIRPNNRPLLCDQIQN